VDPSRGNEYAVENRIIPCDATSWLEDIQFQGVGEEHVKGFKSEGSSSNTQATAGIVHVKPPMSAHLILGLASRISKFSVVLTSRGNASETKIKSFRRLENKLQGG
jgi:hypothetical protein